MEQPIDQQLRFAGRSSMTSIEAMPASASAHAIALPAPPAPSSTTLRPRTRYSLAFHTAHESDAIEYVGIPGSVGFAAQRIYRAHCSRRCADAAGEGEHPGLEGHRYQQPIEIGDAEQRGHDASKCSAGTWSGTMTALRPASAKHSEYSCGDRTWAIGSPMIA